MLCLAVSGYCRMDYGLPLRISEAVGRRMLDRANGNTVRKGWKVAAEFDTEYEHKAWSMLSDRIEKRLASGLPHLVGRSVAWLFEGSLNEIAKSYSAPEVLSRCREIHLDRQRQRGERG